MGFLERLAIFFGADIAALAEMVGLVALLHWMYENPLFAAGAVTALVVGGFTVANHKR